MSDVIVTLAMLVVVALVLLLLATLWLVFQMLETRAIARELARAHILKNRYDKWGASFGFEHDHDDQALIGEDMLSYIFGSYRHGGGVDPEPDVTGKHWKYQS